jgi:CheY-like chemotaxis protein
VIRLDMSMPVMNGWEFAAADRAATQPPARAPIVVVMAASDAAERADQLRAAGFVGMPFDLDQLIARVADALAKQE